MKKLLGQISFWFYFVSFYQNTLSLFQIMLIDSVFFNYTVLYRE